MSELNITNDTTTLDWAKLESLFKKVGWVNHTELRISKSFKNSDLVALGYVNNQLIGCGRVLTDGEFYAAIYDVVIDPDYQGKGIGKSIVNYLLEHLENVGFVHLIATLGNEGFYRNLGLKKHKTAMARYLNTDLAAEYLE